MAWRGRYGESEYLSLQIVSPSDLCLKEVSFSGCGEQGEIGPLCYAVRFTKPLIQYHTMEKWILEIRMKGSRRKKCISFRNPYFSFLFARYKGDVLQIVLGETSTRGG
ncbi:hypothetical protein TNIN_259921 [Trichonephila inaurata madagascariensis]|uniref:Uncharacterized protein n=1 Tax=Trichonephila inaurata madagascariensis TaxID=2747483 RepID=A0A8X6WXJ6_9ARAC|nr:hypothetical protein TNIN_259921 [Trichonephila inaurata madagascariensis]